MVLQDIKENILTSFDEQVKDSFEKNKIELGVIEREYKLKAEGAIERILAQGEKEAAELARQLLTPVRLNAQKEILLAKEALIDEVFLKALTSLKSLSEAEELTLLKNFYQKSSKDLKVDLIEIFPAKGFKEKVFKALEKEKVKILAETARVQTGFILKVEGLEIKVSYEALLLELRERLTPQIVSLILTEESYG